MGRSREGEKKHFPGGWPCIYGFFFFFFFFFFFPLKSKRTIHFPNYKTLQKPHLFVQLFCVEYPKKMAFWGVYVKPEEPYVLKPDHNGRRLRITQAVLGEKCGDGSTTTMLQCSVGNKLPISICLLSMKMLSCYPLNLEFEEREDVIFSVVGPIGVYLSGSYLPQCDSCRTSGDGPSAFIIKYFDSKTSEKAADMEGKKLKITTEANNEKSKIFTTEEAENEEDKKLSITEEAENKKDEDIMTVGLAEMDEDKMTVEVAEMDKDKMLNSIEEDIGDSDSFTNGSFSDSEEDNYDFSDSFIEDGGLSAQPYEQELPIAEATETKVEDGKHNKRKSSSKRLTGNQSIGGDSYVRSKQKQQTTLTANSGIDRWADCTRGSCSNNKSNQKPKTAKNSSSKVGGVDHTKGSGCSNRSNRKLRTGENSASEVDEGAAIEIGTDGNLGRGEKNKFTHPAVGGTKREGRKSQTKKRKQERNSSGGIVIEELAKGESNGKIATTGKEVKIIYSAWIKETGKVLESNVGQAPFKFELGDEEIIKAWNIGVEGMQVGGIRRLVVPPSMGSWRMDESTIPANSMLVYDIELVGVL